MLFRGVEGVSNFGSLGSVFSLSTLVFDYVYFVWLAKARIDHISSKAAIVIRTIDFLTL